MPDPSPKKPVKIAPPTGTRDFYPREMLVRRYITDAWRRTALRHGFDEIDGPTFESAELYKVKSGEGILNEMFGVYSGKGLSEPDAQEREFDPRNPPFGLRPEFTPTLARMYAARAKQLPQPTKWFCVSNFFRAERPQRGRLREFWQWNCDVIGGEDLITADAEVVSCVVDLMGAVGLTSENARAYFSDRVILDAYLLDVIGIRTDQLESARDILDRGTKMTPDEVRAYAISRGFDSDRADYFSFQRPPSNKSGGASESEIQTVLKLGDQRLVRLNNAFAAFDLGDWKQLNLSIVRGLAYYTGTVFEVIAEGERAVAGGGRYDNLIELFGGPPTPACGFGMGDAVLGNLLEDRKLIPEGREMLEALSRPMPLRPDVFVIASPNEGCEELIVPTVARLRRGEESEKYKQGEVRPWSAERYSVPPLHARRSYKATKNVGKLLADAGACHARFAAIIESPEKCTLKHMDTGEQTPDVLLDQLARRVSGTA